MKKYVELAELEMTFFLVGHFDFFFQQKKIASFSWKQVNFYRIARIFPNFDDYSDFQKNQGVYRNMRHTVFHEM